MDQCSILFFLFYHILDNLFVGDAASALLKYDSIEGVQLTFHTTCEQLKLFSSHIRVCENDSKRYNLSNWLYHQLR